MNRTLKAISSLELMVVLLLLLAFTCAVATFIENDFGPLGAKSFIYGTTWFESIMVVLTLSIIINIIYFKMYSRKKFSIFMIHISFVFLLIGAGLTRYLGYEGVMTIPENALQNRMLSNDEYIQATLSDGNTKVNYEKKVLMTSLSQTSLDEDVAFLDKNINIKFNRFVPNATEKIVPHKNGQAMINLIVTKFDGANNYELLEGKEIETTFATFSLNKKVTSKKPVVTFTTDENNVYIQSNLEVSYSSLNGKRLGSIKANQKKVLKPYHLYSVAQTRFVTPEFAVKGKLDVVSLNQQEIKKENNLHAVVLDVTYNNTTRSIPLFGKGGSSQGFKKKIKFEDVTIELQWGAKIITLPFSLLLNDFVLERYPGSNAPSSFSSNIKLYDTEIEEQLLYKIYMNNTLDYKGYRFFQSSYKEDESATILSVNKDPGKIPTYIGYFILFAGLILNLFAKQGRFQKLAHKSYTIESTKKNYFNQLALVLLMLFCFNTQSNAIEHDIIKSIEKGHANEFGAMLIQDYQGRIKPVNSLAIEITNKVSKTNSLYELNENQIFLSMMLYPKVWQNIKFIKIKNDHIKILLNLNKKEKLLAFSDIYDEKNNYILEKYLEIANNKKPSEQSQFDKDLIKIDERLNIAYKVFTGGFLKLYPKIGDKNNLWLDPVTARTQTLQPNENENIQRLTKNYFLALKNKEYHQATQLLNDIKVYQKQYGSTVLKNDIKIHAELLFNQLNIFNNLTPYYLTLGIILFIFVFIDILSSRSYTKQLSRIILALFFIGFIVHTFGMALRWYIAEYAPWSNAYESMIYIAWAIVLSGMIFSRVSKLALSTTGILAGIILFVAHLSWLEPQITTLVPVLKSYWLTIHVSVITASYGFFGLCALLGFITLILYVILNPKHESERFFSILTSIKETRRINEMSMFIGLALLIMGNFLGGIWANESWGRYWGWDPKETWTLVSILIYAVILHLHYIKGLNSNYLFSCLSMLAYSAIIMTYFGVNYYLAGMHSYAAGDPIPIPSFIPIAVFVMIVLMALAFKNRKVV